MSYTINRNCRVCSAGLDTALDLGSTPLANEYPDRPSPDQERFPLYLAECRDCGHIQLPVVVNPDRLFREYRYASGTTAAFRQHLETLAREIIRAAPLSANDLVVDIGSNDGTLLEEFQGRGMRVVGIDPALNLASEASGRGVLTVPTFFNERTALRVAGTVGRADCITLLNVFAHSNELGSMAAGIKELLAPHGVAVIEVGSSASVTDGVYDLVYHEHAAFWHLSPLSRFLAKHGLTVSACETVDSQGGSLRCWVRHAENDNAEFVKPFVDWAAVRAKVEAHRANLRDMVERRERVALYGVSAKATTLLHYCGLTNMIDAAYDDGSMKVGRYVPGTSIEIRPVERIYEDKPRALLLGSWNFAEQIMGRHAGYRGEWIVPFPELRVA